MTAATLVRDAPLAHLRWGHGARMAVLLHGIGGGRAAWDDALSGTGAALAVQYTSGQCR